MNFSVISTLSIMEKIRYRGRGAIVSCCSGYVRVDAGCSPPMYMWRWGYRTPEYLRAILIRSFFTVKTSTINTTPTRISWSCTKHMWKSQLQLPNAGRSRGGDKPLPMETTGSLALEVGVTPDAISGMH